eukprot:2129989-Pleurochrysis_carterae.AAC.1
MGKHTEAVTDTRMFANPASMQARMRAIARQRPPPPSAKSTARACARLRHPLDAQLVRWHEAPLVVGREEMDFVGHEPAAERL